MLNQFEVPEWVYLKKPQFVDCDEELLAPLLHLSKVKPYLHCSLQSIQVDARVCELMEFSDQTGLSFTLARDVRIRQVEGSLGVEGDAELVRYLEFLRGL